MVRFKNTLILLTALFMLSLAACGKDTPSTEDAAAQQTYNISVLTQGGMALSDIELYIYQGDTLAGFGQTDETGSYSLSLPEQEGYTIRLESIPKGYTAEDTYTFTGTDTDIMLTSALITDDALSGARLGVGDVMYDFTIPTADGGSFTLSEVLEEKDMVLLNFWYSTCGPCANEFPFMQSAYEEFSDKAAVIALDPLEEMGTVTTYQATMGLTFPMAACPASWSSVFSLTGYPTSVVIDRYGVICLIEVGAVTSQRPFTKLFEHFTAENYEQKLFTSLSELVTVEKPNVAMASSEEVAAVLSPGLEISYRPETEGESAEYSWPFVITEKNGESCLKASNQDLENSYAILYADVFLEEGQAVAFDYLSSTEGGCDVLYVIVDDEDVYQISGMDEEEAWKTCYPWVATESRDYEVALCYLKDGDSNVGDDTVYLKNLRITDAAAIDTPTYIPRLAFQEPEEGVFTYPEIVLSQADGYYHVGSENGPLLLADLMNYTPFSPETTLWELTYEGKINQNGQNIYDTYVDYFSYASNSQISGVCPVNEGLREFLAIADDTAGFDSADPNEWLKLCRYYQSYGTDVQLGDPIAGLTAYSAYTAKLGKNIDTNYFYYDRPIMPRGLLAAFTPERSGVYRITSRCDSQQGVEAWIFGEDRETDAYTYERDLRLDTDGINVNMVYYMEAGRTYYIDIAFWDIYEVGYIYYDIEYVAAEYDAFRLASPGYFTYDTNATGERMYDLISGGIDVVLGEDGIYYQDLGDGRKGSKLYADFTGVTGLFNLPLADVDVTKENGDTVTIKGIISQGGFDFSKTDLDMYVLGILEKEGSPEKAREYLRAYWGEDYDTYAEEYHLEEVLSGKYHGHGEDYTEAISAYLDDIITSGPEERRGCVVVTEELAQLLQMLVDKYSFSGVDHSWTKLCYYYDHLGPA